MKRITGGAVSTLCAALLLAFAAGSYAESIVLDESPAKANEWGYRPADGATSELNPPGFSWRPTKGAEKYELQISPAKNFSRIAYETKDARWSAYCPPVVLAPDTYFWRYRAIGREGGVSNWSRVRSFTVTDKSIPFPKPAPKDFAAHIPVEHPRLFFRDSDLSAIREWSRGPLADKWKAIERAADKILASPPDTAEPPKYRDGIERKGEEWKEVWWGNRLKTIAVADSAATLAFAYRVTNDEKYLTGARDLLMAFAEWDPKGSTNYTYNDEAAMPALYFPSRAATWASPGLDKSQRDQLIEVMRVRARDCYDHLQRAPHLWKPYSSHSNRAWHFLGEVAVAFYHEIPEAPMWLDFALTVFYTAYPVWSDTDGGWHEGAPYWSSYLERFFFWADIMQSTFNVSVFDRPFFNQTGDFAMVLIPPGTTVSGFGDMAPNSGANRYGNLMMTLAAGAKNPHWRWYAERVGGDFPPNYLGFLRAGRSLDLASAPPETLPTSRVFRGVGIAALNTTLLDGAQNVQLLFKSSPMGRQSHGYNSNNAFLLNIGGKPAFISTGRRDVHGSKHHTEWMWDSKSDNVILVNGEGQVKHSPESTGEITQFAQYNSFDVLVGEAADSYGGRLDRWTRRIIFLRPHAIVIHDVLEAPEPSTFQWLLHSPSEFQVTDNGMAWSGDGGKASVTFLMPDALAISQHDRFDPPPAEWTNWNLKQWHLTAESNEPAKQRQFLALIRVNDADVGVREMKTTSGFPELQLELPGGTATLMLGENDFSVIRGNERFDSSRAEIQSAAK